MKYQTGIIVGVTLLLLACAPKTKEIRIDETSRWASEAYFPEWSYDATIYEVNIRQYTPEGTFAAFGEHLPRLKKLGVEILWFMPIHPISEKGRKGTLGSYYAAQDYKAVNPEFGTLRDFKKLVAECHKMGFKVLLDWVANHTGRDHIWMSEHPDWYITDSTGSIISPVPDWSDVADLNYDNPDMQEAMIDALEYWVREADIDGYRCDVAGMVPVEFWEKARSALDKIKPVFMLAEDEGEKALLNKAFNMNYGWHFHHIMNRVAKGVADAKEIKAYFAAVDSTYPAGSYPMHFTSNHDENSWNGTEFERLGDAAKTMAALTFVVPGMPLIYTGQEAGNLYRLAFFDKDEVDWSNPGMQDFYSTLIDLKKNNPALWNGLAGAPVNFLQTTGGNSLLAFYREKDHNRVLAFFNLTPKTITSTFNSPAIAGTYTDALTCEEVTLEERNVVFFEGWGYRILRVQMTEDR